MTEQVVTEETAESTESTDATELDETTEISDEEELYSHTEDCNENTKRVVASYEVYLTAGTYYIKVMEATAVLNL